MNPLDAIIAVQILFAAAFVALGTVLGRAALRRRRFAARSIGEIVSLRMHASGGGAGISTAIPGTVAIGFTTATGDEVLAHVELGDVRGKVGARIALRYDPHDPSSVRIGSELTRGVITAAWLLAIATVIEVIAVITTVATISATGG